MNYLFLQSFASFRALTQCQHCGQLIAILARFITNHNNRANPSTSRVHQIVLSSMQKLELDTQRSLELNIHIEKHSKYVRLSTFVMGVSFSPSFSPFLFIQQNIQTLFALAYIEHWCLPVVPLPLFVHPACQHCNTFLCVYKCIQKTEKE